MQIHSHTFLQLGGNPDWLRGTDHLPAKLRHLLPLNSILAHQPWLLGSHHIAAVVKVGGWLRGRMLLLAGLGDLFQ